MSRTRASVAVILALLSILSVQLTGCGDSTNSVDKTSPPGQTPAASTVVATPSPRSSPLPTSSPKVSATPGSTPRGATPTATVPTGPQRYTRVLAEIRVEYRGGEAGGTIPKPPEQYDSYQIVLGSGQYSNDRNAPGSTVDAVTHLITWSPPPLSYVEGDDITISTTASGRTDLKRGAPPNATSSVAVLPDGSVGGGGGTTNVYVYQGAMVGSERKYTIKTPTDPTDYRIVIDVALRTRYEAYVTYLYVRQKDDVQPTPLVFIPGILGSQLVGQDGHALWPPEGPGANRALHPLDVGNDLARLSLNPASKHEKVIATDVIWTDGSDKYYGPLLDYLVATGGYVEYQVGGDVQKRTASGFNLSQVGKSPTLFIFAYDWRLDIAENAKALADYVAGIQKLYPNKKVNIVAHSMGGLVARRYILDNPGKVNKLITIATPFLGSPKPLYQMIYGTTGIGWKDDRNWALFGDALKELQEFSPGVHQLMASQAYFDLGGKPYRVVQPEYGVNELPNYAALMGPRGIVEGLFIRPSYNGKTPAQNNQTFHSYSANGNKQDDWGNDTTGVSYFHIVGVQKSNDTPFTLQERLWLGEKGWTFTEAGPGDGTVPRLSAERIAADGRSMNAPNARIYVYSTGDDKLLEHTGLVTNPEVQGKVLEILKSR